MVVTAAAFRQWRCVCLVVAGAAAQLSCGGSTSAPTPTSSTGGAVSSLTIARGAPAVPSVVAVTAGDFGRCLQEAGTPACFDAAGLGRAAAVAGLTAPGAPGSLVATSTGSSVTLTWRAPTSGDPVLAYIIEAGSSSGAANLASVSTGNSATIFSATGVGGGNYYVRVRATNAAGASAPSNEVLLAVACTTAPGAPSGLRVVSNSGGTVVLSWTGASGCPTSYIVQAGSTAGASNLVNSDLGSAATTLTANGVGAGTYYVRVRAKNAFGTGNPSNEITLTVGGTSLPRISDTVGVYGRNRHSFTVNATGQLIATLTWANPSVDLDLYLTASTCTTCTILTRSTGYPPGTSEQVRWSVRTGEGYSVWVDNWSLTSSQAYTIEFSIQTSALTFGMHSQPAVAIETTGILAGQKPAGAVKVR